MTLKPAFSRDEILGRGHKYTTAMLLLYSPQSKVTPSYLKVGMVLQQWDVKADIRSLSSLTVDRLGIYGVTYYCMGFLKRLRATVGGHRRLLPSFCPGSSAGGLLQ